VDALVESSGGIVRPLFILTLVVIPVAAQSPLVRVLNLSRPLASEFQIGDRFEIQVAAAPGQPISVRTGRQGRTDWGAVIASTDGAGRWHTEGQFEKSDFGHWREVWTIGGRLASPVIEFDVKASCLPGGEAHASMSGPNVILTCDTADGRQTFVTPSASDSIRMPDGRLVPARPALQTPEQYHMELLSDFITGAEVQAAESSLSSSRGGLGDETADLIVELIGVNALNEKETRNVLAIVRAAFDKPERIAPGAKEPSKTLLLLRHLADASDQDSVRKQIDDTIAYLLAR
jgi:hypothetical protein